MGFGMFSAQASPIAVDFGSSSIKLLQIASPEKPTLVAAAELPVPEGVSLTVVGDTAFDAKVIRQACDQRGYQWIVPCNANRVFNSRRSQRPRVSSRLDQLSKKRFIES